MFEMRKSGDRGVGRLDWLSARFTFSFGPYQDPHQLGFSDLRLLNDDRVEPAGFATHEHRDTEVFSYVLEGALEHKDSMGKGSVVPRGDVLMMSAGTGITHSEFNPSKTDKLRFLQIWMSADRKGAMPRYNQKHYGEKDKRGTLRQILGPEGRAPDGAMPWYVDCSVYCGLFDGAEKAELALGPNRYAYVHVINGRLKVNGTQFEDGDGARVRNERTLAFANGENAEILVFDLRPLEVPDK